MPSVKNNPYSIPQLIYLTMHTFASYSETETNEVYMRKDNTLYKHAQSDPNLVAYV